MKLTRAPYPQPRTEAPLAGDELREPQLPRHVERLFARLREPELDMARRAPRDD